MAALYELTDRLYRAETPSDVYSAALDAIENALSCDRASILLFDEAGVMRFVAWRGLSDAYRAAVDGHSPWKRGERPPQPIFVSDIAATDESDEIKRAILSEDIVGLAFIPLVARGGVVGKFMTYYDHAHAFTAREIELAVTIARQVGFSLERTQADQARAAAEEALRDSEERFRLMLENAPAMIWMSDTEGGCLHLNRRLREFWGVPDNGIDGASAFDWTRTIHPDDAPDLLARMGDALARRAPTQVRARYRNARGDYRVLVTDAEPRFGETGEFLGVIGVNTDVTEREEAERALRESEERFRLAVEAAPSGMVISDEEGTITLVNEQAERLFGYERHELVGASIELLVPAPSRAAHADMREGQGGERRKRIMGADRVVTARRKDGTEFPAEIGLSPILSATGRLWLAAVVDISERRRADAQRDLLLAELNHRVKNTLAVVQGIAHQTFKGGGATPAARAAFEGRLHALALAHSMLTRTNWSHAPLTQVAGDALGTAAVARHRIAISGPTLLLAPKAALGVTMALHELLTNAIKYGALSNDQGTIELKWELVEGSPARFRLEWRERGGPPVTPPARRGFGSRLITRILADDLDGDVQLGFEPDGVSCTMTAPVARLAEA